MREKLSRKLQPTKEEAYFEVKDSFVYAFNMIARHARKVLPKIKDITLLANSEGTTSGLVVGYLDDGEERIIVPIGAISPDGEAWTTLSAIPMSAMGHPKDIMGKIRRRILHR